jgi:hypothetical protein
MAVMTDQRGSNVRDWVLAREPGTCFTSADVPGRPETVAVALSRLAAPGGPIVRARRGIYWRATPETRFGRAAPDPEEVALLAAGAGAGPSGVSAANRIGISTQVPRRPHLAVVGRIPKGLPDVRFTSRANPHRIRLSPMEVAVLEAVRDLDRHSEVPWPVARRRIRRMADAGTVDLAAITAVAAHERRAGLQERMAELLAS